VLWVDICWERRARRYQSYCASPAIVCVHVCMCMCVWGRRKYASSDSLSASLDSQLKLFAAMDTDGSGGLDREEFMAASEHITDPSFLEWCVRVPPLVCLSAASRGVCVVITVPLRFLAAVVVGILIVG
jgi:hypothetical protein